MSILIEIAKRRQSPGTGSVIGEIQHANTRMFRKIISVPYALIDGQATRSYMPERSTLDWDILVASHHLEHARSDVLRAGAEDVRALTIPGFSCRLRGGILLDVIAEDAEWVEAALAESCDTITDDRDPVLPLCWLVLLKLRAGRVQDLADVSRMMGYASSAGTRSCREVVSRWFPDASEDLDSLIHLGRLETGREKTE